jgi:hypothetical protein
MSNKDPQFGYELTDIHSKKIMGISIGFIFSAIVIHLSLSAFFFSLRRQNQKQLPLDTQSQLLKQRIPPPEPRLQTKPNADLQVYLSQEKQSLSSYGWIHQKKGIVRIPIERAMILLVNPSQSGSSNE